MILFQIISGVRMFLRLLACLVLVSCVLSWIVPAYSKVRQALDRVVQPLCDPFRRLLFRLTRRYMTFDLSPFLALLALSVVNGLLGRLQYAVLGIF